MNTTYITDRQHKIDRIDIAREKLQAERERLQTQKEQYTADINAQLAVMQRQAAAALNDRQLVNLTAGMSWTEAGHLLGVSRQTAKRAIVVARCNVNDQLRAEANMKRGQRK